MKIQSGFEGRVPPVVKKDHFGVSSGSPIRDPGVVRNLGINTMGDLFSDISSGASNLWSSATSWMDEPVSAEQVFQTGSQIVGTVMNQGGTTPQTISQAGNVKYPTLPAGAVPVPTAGGATSWDATLKKYGLTKNMVLYGGAAFTSVLLLLLLWPKKKSKPGSHIQYVSGLPGAQMVMPAPIPMQANPCRSKKRRKKMKHGKRRSL